MSRYSFGYEVHSASKNFSQKEGAIHMKFIIPITGTLAAISCAVWAYLSYTSRKQVVLYQTPCTEHGTETA